ncbi:manganese efflux pump [Paenibacillus alba]|uniref:manganese efflux pump n=1 Tax=Paenibacillus alba TaxID=1197127 RepID=UPI001563068C|nr:manganese efflux pump [Paenibacillus alba]NQX66480.1 manganese efflux pump [Paenibacillus alba]
MTAWLLILGFAVSSSLDNLGVGISYGIRGTRIGFSSNVVIAIICFLFSMVGILSGQWLSKVLPGIYPVLVGAFLLFIVGIRIILLALPRKKQHLSREVEHIETSRDIGLGEAIILGVALSVNAITNGLGAGLLGLSPLAISITAALGSFITVWFGVLLGQKVAGIRIGSFTVGQFGTILSGIMLLLIASNSLFG